MTAAAASTQKSAVVLELALDDADLIVVLADDDDVRQPDKEAILHDTGYRIDCMFKLFGMADARLVKVTVNDEVAIVCDKGFSR